MKCETCGAECEALECIACGGSGIGIVVEFGDYGDEDELETECECCDDGVVYECPHCDVEDE